MSETAEKNEVPFRTTILVVEDDPDFQGLLCRAIRRAGHHPVCTADGHHALRLFEQLNPAAVLLDLMLPTLSGFEICRRIRKTGARVPVVAITSRDLPEDEAHAEEVGFDLFLNKPVRMDDVSRTVAELLGTQGRTPA